MSLESDDDRPQSPRFDRKNFAVGTALSAVLVALLGDGPVILFQARTPEEEGVNIGGAMLGTVGMLLAVAFGYAFTARRARRRGGQPKAEALAAAVTGAALAVVLPELVIGMIRDPMGGGVTVAAVLVGLGVGLRLPYHRRRGRRRP